MFSGLQKKWKVSPLQVVLILCTFAIGGSLTGYVAKKIMDIIGLDKNAWWVVIYIVIVTILWPLAVLLISIPFGQYRFFVGYLSKMKKRIFKS